MKFRESLAGTLIRGAESWQFARWATAKRRKGQGDALFPTLLIVLMVVWGFGWIVFRASGVLIHILLLVALISLAVHFFRGRV